MPRRYPPITTLIPDLKSGDEDSWNSLVELFTPGLTGKAIILLRDSKLGSRLSPDDLVNETFAKSWKRQVASSKSERSNAAKWNYDF